MEVLTTVLWAALGAKLLWNVSVPILLWKRISRDEAEAYTSGVSLAPIIEVFLLVLLAIVSWMAPGASGFDTVLSTVLAGLAATAISYLLMVLLGVVLGAATAKRDNRG